MEIITFHNVCRFEQFLFIYKTVVIKVQLTNNVVILWDHLWLSDILNDRCNCKQ